MKNIKVITHIYSVTYKFSSLYFESFCNKNIQAAPLQKKILKKYEKSFQAVFREWRAVSKLQLTAADKDNFLFAKWLTV